MTLLLFYTYPHTVLTISTHIFGICHVKLSLLRLFKQVFYSFLAGPVPLSVYQRLKKLEDRILELEGLSPEYFQSTVSVVALK